MGRVSYWLGNLPPREASLTNKIAFAGTTGKPLFDCNNHVYIYIDGMHVGNSDGVLGEIFPNEVRGTNATFPIFERLANQTLRLAVDKVQVDVPLANIQPIDKADLLGTQDNVNTEFIFLEPDDNLGLKIFKNGLRLINELDFRFFIDGVSKQGTVTFSVPPSPGDKLSVLFQYAAGSFILEERMDNAVDGVNTIFTLGTYPRAETIEIYLNGIRVVEGIDYSVAGATITFYVAPEVDSIVVADYQPSTAKIQYVFVQTPAEVPNGEFAEFLFTTPSIIGQPHIFKNGLLQNLGLFFDYTIVNENKVVFNPWTIPEPGDILSIVFYATPVLLSQMVDYLNQTQQFKDNCLTASTLNIQPIQNLFYIQGNQDGTNTFFTLPLTDVPANIRLFKNGARLKELKNNIGDYFLDHTKGLIVFSIPPEPGDSIIGLLNYITTNFVIGEVPFGVMDGSNTLFTTSMIPKASSVQVYYNGIRLNPFTSVPDYSVSQNKITFLTFTPAEGDIIVVDYEIAFGFETFTSSIIPTGQATGYNADFGFPTPEKGTAVHVFLNGLLQNPGFDYNQERNKIHFYDRSMPQSGDLVLLEFNDAALFTNNPNDQLRISSPYPLDIKRYSNNKPDVAEQALFGDDVELYPGKDEDGEFRFWFNSRTGYWRWTWYDPSTGVTTPFTAGQRITARVKNDSPFIYTTKR